MKTKVTVIVCDECGSAEVVESYEVKKGTRRVKVDYCADHNGPLEAIFSKAPKRTTARAATPRVTTMEEIEAMKTKPAKKTAPRKRTTKKAAAAAK